jgi:hypothetical protein
MYTLKLNIGSWTSPVLGNGYVLSEANATDVNLIKERDDEFEGVVRTKINGNFIFRNKTVNEYGALYTLKSNNDIFIEAQILYDNDIRIEGIINIKTGEWDENKKTASLTFQSRDSYTAIYDKINDEYNIKDVTLRTIKTRYRSQNFYINTPVTSYSTFGGYVLHFNPDGSPSSGDPGDIAPEWDYYTYISTTPSGSGYIHRYATNVLPFAYDDFEENNYLKDAPNQPDPQYAYPPYNTWHSRADLTEVNAVRSTLTFTEFVKLYDLIEYMMSDIDSTVSVSEEYYCPYFTEEETEYDYIVIADKSDIKRFSASDKAEYENITWSKLMNFMKWMFNLDWKLNQFGVFSLFRPQSFELPDSRAYPKHDFTIIDDGDSVTNNQQKYTYDAEKYKKEKWKFEESSFRLTSTTSQVDSMFSKNQIEYDSLDENSDEKDLSDVNNNIWYLWTDPEAANDTGFVFAVTELDGDRYIRYKHYPDLEYYQNPSKQNYLMSAESLLEVHHKIDRPYPSGTLNGSVQSFTEKEDQELKFNNIPIEDINDLNFDYLVKTELGNAKLQRLEIPFDLRDFAKVDLML